MRGPEGKKVYNQSILNVLTKASILPKPTVYKSVHFQPTEKPNEWVQVVKNKHQLRARRSHYNQPDFSAPPPGYNNQPQHNHYQQQPHNQQPQHTQQPHNQQPHNQQPHNQQPHNQTNNHRPRPFIFPRPSPVPHFATDGNRIPIGIQTQNRFSLLSQQQNFLN